MFLYPLTIRTINTKHEAGIVDRDEWAEGKETGRIMQVTKEAEIKQCSFVWEKKKESRSSKLRMKEKKIVRQYTQSGILRLVLWGFFCGGGG